MTPRAPENGFTLVEMLVSLAVLALFTTLLMQAAGSGRKVAATIEQRTQAGEYVQSTESMLRSRLAQIVPLAIFGGSQVVVDFSGEEREIRFVGPPGDADRPSALVRQRLWLSGSGDLLLGREDGFEQSNERELEREIVVPGISRLAIDYFGTDFRGVTAWHDRWVASGELPKLIRIRISQRQGSRTQQWPDLVIRPFATVNRACLLDPATGDCRRRG